MMVGRDRDTGHHVSLMGATAHLKQWHLADVTDPEALFVLGTAAGNWTHAAAQLALLAAPPPIAWQPPAAWTALVARWLAPARPQLAACASTVLG